MRTKQILMVAINLTSNHGFTKENDLQQKHLLSDVTLAAIIAWAVPLALVFFLCLIAALQSSPVPWSHVTGLMDELVFTIAILWVLLSLPGIARYLSWRVLVASLKLLITTIIQAMRTPLPARRVPMKWFWKNQHQQILAYTRQLRERLIKRPPSMWTRSRAPLRLFQQAALLLAP